MSATDMNKNAANVYLSVVVPLYNEKDNVAPLCAALRAVLDRMGRTYEVLLVDDGSHDGTAEALAAARAHWPQLTVLELARNYGQTAALSAGLDHASGEVLVTLDGDLQNDPEDIPAMIETLERGHDLVCGWRRDRKDNPIKRNFLSRLANRLIAATTGITVKDIGCTLKAFRRHLLLDLRLYGEMHRFIPVYAQMQGARIAEQVVQHHPRRFGQSKYGLSRIFKVLLDLLVVRYLERYLTKPIYLFGMFSLACFAFAFGVLFLMLWLKFFHGYSMIATPLPILSAMGVIVGALSLLQGLSAEIISRTYFESQNKAVYKLRNIYK